MTDICHCANCAGDAPADDLEMGFCGCVLKCLIYGIECDCRERSRAAKLEPMARPQIPEATSSRDYLLTPLPGVIACGRGQKCDAFALEDDMFLWYLPVGSPGMVGELCDTMAEVAAIVGRDESELPRFTVVSAIDTTARVYGEKISMDSDELDDFVNQRYLDGYEYDYELQGSNCFHLDVLHNGAEAYIIDSNDYSVTRFRTVAEAVDYICQVTGEA